MNESNTKQAILNFLRDHSLTGVSYINDKGTVSSATVEYTVTDELEVLFTTFVSKRKYGAIKDNPNVSLVVGWDWDENITVQYEGKAQELTGAQLLKHSKYYFKKLPDAEKFFTEFRSLGKPAFFKVKPSWIRYSDFNKEPWDITEIKF